MKHVLQICVTAVLAVLVTSCEWVGNLIHDDEVVARIDKRRLYRSDLAEFIPHDVSAEDSAVLAQQFINTWAMDQLYLDIAGEQLSKEEMDVSRELEDYRRSLLKFRYEQRYVAERLDTVVSRSEIEAYFDAHKDMFKLNVPIVKARFLDIMKESPSADIIRKKMSSDKYDDLVLADSLAFQSALKYEDWSDVWVEMPRFAQLFGTDYGFLLSRLRPDGFVVIEEEQGDVKVGYVCDIRRPGTFAPMEYCEERIRDIIISNRKRALLSSLERDLLEDAIGRQKLIIF